MTVQIEKALFDTLSVGELGHACFAPMVSIYQNAVRANISRAEFIKSLSRGQRALFMFFVYHDHAIRSLDEFKKFSGNFLSEHIFEAVKKSAEYFDCDMFLLMQSIEQAVSAGDELDALFTRFSETAPLTIAKIGSFIRENPAEFVELS